MVGEGPQPVLPIETVTVYGYVVYALAMLLQEFVVDGWPPPPAARSPTSGRPRMLERA
jgi:hypothetical protein